MNHQQLESLGDRLRHLGHQRREVVERIMADTQKGSTDEAKQLYQQLDQISEAAMSLMSEQRQMIAEELRT